MEITVSFHDAVLHSFATLQLLRLHKKEPHIVRVFYSFATNLMEEL